MSYDIFLFTYAESHDGVITPTTIVARLSENSKVHSFYVSIKNTQPIS